MPRPSLAPKRREEILRAFEACVAENGLAGASLRKIAEKAGVKQPVIHHYFGPREELVAALFDRIVARYTELVDRLVENDGELTLERFLDFLFTGDFAAAASHDSVVGELIAASDRDERAKAVLDRIFAHMEETVAGHLASFFPNAGRQVLGRAAYALTALIEGHAILAFHFEDPQRARAAREAAERLVAVLASP